LLAFFGRYQLRGDANLGTGAPYRTLDKIGCVNLACDQPCAQVFALERERRIPAENPKERLQRERVNQVFRESVGKILIRAVAEIDERKHTDDRRSILRRQSRLVLRRLVAALRSGWFPGPDINRLGDVLEAMAPGAHKGRRKVLADLIIGFSRQGDAAWYGDRFETYSNIHIIAEYFVLVRHHVAHMDAETELHGTIGRQMIVALRHQHLHGKGGLDRPDDAGIFEQKAVAGILHDPAAMVENERIYRASMGFEGGMRSRLVGTHHAGVAGDVRANDSGQSSVHSFKNLLSLAIRRCRRSDVLHQRMNSLQEPRIEKRQ